MSEPLFSLSTKRRMGGIVVALAAALTVATLTLCPTFANADIVAAPTDPITLVGPPVPKDHGVKPVIDEGKGLQKLSEESINPPLEPYEAIIVDTRARTLITVREGANGAIVLDPPELVDSLVSIIDNSGCVTFINDAGSAMKRFALTTRLKGSGCAVLMVTDGQPTAAGRTDEDIGDMVAATRN